MAILFAIPHYYNPEPQGGRHGHQCASPEARAAALSQCILSLHQHFGKPQCMMQIAHRRAEAANDPFATDVHVVVCTAGGHHLLDRLPIDRRFYHHYPTTAAPRLLGFECQAVLRDRWGNYDWHCYLEDDLILHDPWLFQKLAWFNGHAGEDKLLLPNRFERGVAPLAVKAYVDGDLREQATARFHDLRDQPILRSQVLGTPIVLQRPLNPHSGCYFLSAAQMAHWMRQPHFLDRDTSFIGPFESAATLGVMKTFKIYKPARENASFLEIEHSGRQFISQLRRP